MRMVAWAFSTTCGLAKGALFLNTRAHKHGMRAPIDLSLPHLSQIVPNTKRGYLAEKGTHARGVDRNDDDGGRHSRTLDKRQEQELRCGAAER